MNDIDLGPSMAGLGIDTTSVSALRGSLATILRSASLVRQARPDSEEEEEEDEALPFSSASSDSSEYYDAEESLSDFCENVTLSPQPNRPPPSPQPPQPPHSPQVIQEISKPEISLGANSSGFLANVAPSPQGTPRTTPMQLQMSMDEDLPDFYQNVTPTPETPTTPSSSGSSQIVSSQAMDVSSQAMDTSSGSSQYQMPAFTQYQIRESPVKHIPEASQISSEETSLGHPEKVPGEFIDTSRIILKEIVNRLGDISIPDTEEPSKPSRGFKRASSMRYENIGTKKAVRFADSLGLNLGHVRTYKDELPEIPGYAYLDLAARNFPSSSEDSNRNPINNQLLELRANFPTFGISNAKLQRNKICLLKNHPRSPHHCPSICIDALVLNIAYEKKVLARFTTNKWQSFTHVTGTWINGDEDNDIFQMTFYVPNVQLGGIVEVALCFQCNGTEYWDNNEGDNYVYKCIGASL